MSFTNLLFLTAFLPLSLLLYHLMKSDKARNLLLVALSWLFYAWGGLQSLVLLIIVTLWIWVTGQALDTEQDPRWKTWIFRAGTGFLLLVLILYKYLDFWLQAVGLEPLNLPFPLGISFYTFCAISYLADIRMQRCLAQKSFWNLALYLSFFPKIAQGPITAYHQIEAQLVRRSVTFQDQGAGGLQFVRGLAKKVILADGLAAVVQGLQTSSTFAGVWLLSLAYSFQLYFDFSGYSDMAIGMSRWFGFSLPANFNHPYRATSIRDFWRRWHISLSSWFRDYVYIPLGGSREGKNVLIRNLFIVWLLTGIWHGPQFTFLLWGLYYALLITLERFWMGDVLKKLPYWGKVFVVFLLVNTGWVFFAAPDAATAFVRLGRMIGLGISGFADNQVWFWLRTNALLLAAAILFSGGLYERLQNRFLARWKQPGVLILAGFWILILIICLAAIVGGTSQTFLYFAF